MGTDGKYYQVSTSSVTWHSDTNSCLINFGTAVASFEVLGFADLFQVSVQDRSVLLSFRLSQVSSINLLQAVVSFDSGVSGIVWIPILHVSTAGAGFRMSVTAVPSLQFPNSQLVAIDDTFSLDITRTNAAEGWQDMFTCRFVGGGFSVELIRSFSSTTLCTFSFDELSSGSGRIELYYRGLMVWSFAVEFV